MIVDGGCGQGFIGGSAFPGPLFRRLRVGGRSSFVFQIYTGSFGQVGDGFDEWQVFEVGHELDSVSPSRTPKAIIEAFVRCDAERWGFL